MAEVGRARRVAVRRSSRPRWKRWREAQVHAARPVTRTDPAAPARRGSNGRRSAAGAGAAAAWGRNPGRGAPGRGRPIGSARGCASYGPRGEARRHRHARAARHHGRALSRRDGRSGRSAVRKGAARGRRGARPRRVRNEYRGRGLHRARALRALPAAQRDHHRDGYR